MPDEFGIPTSDAEWKELYETDRSAWHDAWVADKRRKNLKKEIEAERHKQARLDEEKRLRKEAGIVDPEPARPATPTLSKTEILDGIVRPWARQKLLPAIYKDVGEVMDEQFTNTNARIAKIEKRDALRAAARTALLDAGQAEPTPEQVERTVEAFVAKRFSARFTTSAEPAPMLGPGCSIKCPSGRVIRYDDYFPPSEHEWFSRTPEKAFSTRRKVIDPQDLLSATIGTVGGVGNDDDRQIIG